MPLYRSTSKFCSAEKKQRFLDIFFPQNPDEPTVNEADEGNTNEGFSGSRASLAGRKNSLHSTKPETEPMESKTASQEEPETEREDSEESGKPGGPNNTTTDDTRESFTPQQSEDQFSLFSSQLFEHEDEVHKESPSSSPVPSTEPAASGGEKLTATDPTAGSSASQDAELSTSAGKGFWDKAQQLVSQRRSRLEHNRVLPNNDGKITMCVSCFSDVTQIIECYQEFFWNQSNLGIIRNEGNANLLKIQP